MGIDNIICKIYNKKQCIPVYSGTLAIQGLLKLLKTELKANARVLISSVSCYSILEAVLNAGLIPVIATPESGVLFKVDELKRIIETEKIDIYIAVHQYGYYQRIPKIDKLIIIEDLSQAWNIYNNKETVKYDSEYLIHSLGKSKPLNNNIGGLILTNRDITNYFDFKTKNSRMQSNVLLEYVYPLKINYSRLVCKANKKVKRQRNQAKKYNKIFKKYKSISIFEDEEYVSSYHRYVISINVNNKDKFKKILDISKINYEVEFSKKLDKLPVSANNNVIITNRQNNNKNTIFLLKTNINFIKFIRLKREMEKNYED